MLILRSLFYYFKFGLKEKMLFSLKFWIAWPVIFKLWIGDEAVVKEETFNFFLFSGVLSWGIGSMIRMAFPGHQPVALVATPFLIYSTFCSIRVIRQMLGKG